MTILDAFLQISHEISDAGIDPGTIEIRLKSRSDGARLALSVQRAMSVPAFVGSPRDMLTGKPTPGEAQICGIKVTWPVASTCSLCGNLPPAGGCSICGKAGTGEQE